MDSSQESVELRLRLPPQVRPVARGVSGDVLIQDSEGGLHPSSIGRTMCGAGVMYKCLTAGGSESFSDCCGRGFAGCPDD
jgi:hypothetical protein